MAGPPSRRRRPRSWAARRARAWYSGPCLRGSAYSRGLIVQYVPDDGPYHAPPSHSGSSGVSAPRRRSSSPGVALREPRRVWRSLGGASPGPPAPAPSPLAHRVRRCHRCRASPSTPSRRVPAPPPVDVAPARRARHASRDARARVASARHGSGPLRVAEPAPPSRPQPSLAIDEPLVRRLDRQEPRQRAIPRRVGVVLLREPPIRRADLVERRARRDAEGPVRVALEGHRARRGQHDAARRPAPARTRAIASAASRPCGSRDRGRW